MYKYKYLATEPRHLPKHNVVVEKQGDIVETEKPIDNPDFELVEEEEKSKSQLKREAAQKAK